MTQPQKAENVTNTAAFMDRNLALEVARVTEAAALAASNQVGRGDKVAADQVAAQGHGEFVFIVPPLA